MKILNQNMNMNGVLWSDTSKEPEVSFETSPKRSEYDLAIVGGGLCGLSIALESSRRGLSVILLETGKIGNGASGRNGGIVVPQFPGAIRPSDVRRLLGKKKGDQLCELVGGGPKFMFDQIGKYQIQCDAEQNGWVQPAHSAKSEARIRGVFEDWKEFGQPVEWLDRDATFAKIGAPDYLGGWWCQSGGTVNPLALCRGLARAAVSHGLDIVEYAHVSHVLQNANSTEIQWNDKQINARKVVIATNGYADDLFPSLKKTIVPVRLFHTFTKPLTAAQRGEVLPTRVCFTDIRKSGGFCRYSPDGRILSGGLVYKIGDERANGVQHSIERLRQLFPQLGTPEIDYYWEGYCALSATWLPSISVLSKDVYSLAGFSTRGVSISQNLGRLFAEYLVDDRPIEEMPVEVGRPEAFPLRSLKTVLGGYAFPIFKAADRLGLT